MATLKLKETNPKNFCVQDAQRNMHGAWYYPVTQGDTKLHPRIQVTTDDCPIRIPFGASSFNDSARLSLDFSIHTILGGRTVRRVSDGKASFGRGRHSGPPP